MEQPLSFYNWSLNKILKTEDSNFNRAGIKILFSILVFTLIKALVVISIASAYGQTLQLQRAVVLLLIYSVLLKVLLADKAYTQKVAHIIVWLGLFIIWSNVYLFAQTINILTLQFIFMLILGSFYLLGTRYGVIYSVLSSLPVILYLIFTQEMRIPGLSAGELASPGMEIIVVLNFITIVICHYLFQQAFKSNIDEKEALNKKLQLAVEEANHAAESKSKFLSTMTHELRTPLNSVIGISQLLLRDSQNREQEESLQILNFSAVNLHSLINNILDYNKLVSDKQGLEDIPVRLDELLADTCRGLRFQAEQKGIDFVLQVDDAIKGNVVLTDPTRITQIIYNLAGNAIKFTEQGSVSVILELLSFEDEQIQIRFSVRDTGIGISVDKQEAIFESFTQASASTARSFGGTGLGLAIVKRLLLLFNSSVQLESTPGRGSKFSFDISFKAGEKSADLLIEESVADYNLSGLKVLVAEDNHMNRLLLKKIFSGWHNVPDFAINGQEAIDKVRLNEYDIVLMDLNMPLMDGFEATRAIRAMQDPVKSKIPVIAVTASASDDIGQRIREAGMDDYLYKPFKVDELYLKVGRWVQAGRLEG